MKIMMNLIFAVMLLVSLASALAQVEDELPDPGVMPNTPVVGELLYKIDVYFDDQKLLNTEDKLERANIRLEIANERLAELKELNNVKAAEKHVEIVSMQRDKALEKLNEEVAGLEVDEQEKIQERYARHIFILEDLVTKNPLQASRGLVNALSNSRMRYSEFTNGLTGENKANKLSDLRSDFDTGKLERFENSGGAVNTSAIGKSNKK